MRNAIAKPAADHAILIEKDDTLSSGNGLAFWGS